MALTTGYQMLVILRVDPQDLVAQQPPTFSNPHSVVEASIRHSQVKQQRTPYPLQKCPGTEPFGIDSKLPVAKFLSDIFLSL